TGATVAITAGSTSGTAIDATNADAVVTATDGDLTLTATAGGIDFLLGSLHASGDVKLDAVKNVGVKVVHAGGSFTSTGDAVFNTSATGSIDADGDILISHGDSV